MDNYDEQAKDLLTMRSLNEAVEAVAEALRELGEENERLKAQIGKLRAVLRG